MFDNAAIEQGSTQENHTKPPLNSKPLDIITLPMSKTFGEFTLGSEEERASKRWKQQLGENIWGFPELRDPDFVEAFISKIVDSDEQSKYVENSSKFRGNQTDYDPNYVLVYRRTLPSSEPNPERHWTKEYMTARLGLRREIPSTNRLYSVILCSSLKDVLSDSGYSMKPNQAESDGEFKVDTPMYDQKRSIIIFRPKEQQKELEKYQLIKDSLTSEEILQKVKTIKNETPHLS